DRAAAAEAHAPAPAAPTKTTGAAAAPVTCNHRRRAEGARSWGRYVLIFVVARTWLGRYEELRRQFENWRDVSIILDRREGDRRAGQGTYVGVDRRSRVDRRRVDVDMSFMKLGWSIADTRERDG